MGASVHRLSRLLGAGYGATRLRRALVPPRRRTLRRRLAGERASARRPARVHRSRVPLALAHGPQRRAPGGGGCHSRSRLDEGLPPAIVDLHPDRPDQRGIMTPAGTLVLLNPEPTFEA